MSDIRKIIRLPVRGIGNWNPKWVNNALRSFYAKRARSIKDDTSFGRHWKIMGEIRDKCLPQLASFSPFIRVLDVGIGRSPYPEVYELKDLLMKAGIRHRVSVLDIKREALVGLMQQRRLEVKPREISNNDVPMAYYDPFLGSAFTREAGKLVLSLPDKLMRGTRYYLGDIATSILPRSEFDLIICLNVFTYLSDILGQLAMFNMANSLRPGGFLIMDGMTEWGLQANKSMNLDTMHWFNSSRLAVLGFKISYGPLKHNARGMSFAKYNGIFALQRD